MADRVTIYHNPKCGTSRRALELLRGRGYEPEIIEYLKTPPTPARLKQILAMLEMKPRELIRRKEKVYTELGLDSPKLSDAEIIMALAAHPVLIERPIVILGNRAALGRPAERVMDILDK